MAGRTQNQPVAIDARMLGREATGVATYARALEAALRLAQADLTRISDPSCSRPMGPATHPERWLRWISALVDRPRRLRRDGDALGAPDIFRLAQVHFDRHGTLLRLRSVEPAGIVFWTYPLPIRIDGWTNIYTVHDAIPLTHPELSEIEPDRHRRLLNALAASAQRLLTVSDAARADIIAALGCGPDLIRSCPPGLAVAGVSGRPDGRFAPGGYLLFVGSIEPRKNLLRLVEAHRRSGVSMPLVLVGPNGWRSSDIVPLLEAAPRVVRLPYADRQAVVDLMAHARALLLPSIVEGFGLPIVEAMQLGTPVLTSRGGATQEVGGDAVLLADAESADDLAAQIRRLATDDELAARLRSLGRDRASAYTPQAFAARLKAIQGEFLSSQMR